MKKRLSFILLIAPFLGLCEEDFLVHFRNTSVAKHLHEATEFANPNAVPDGVYIAASEEDASFCILSVMSSSSKDNAIQDAATQLYGFFEAGSSVGLKRNMPVLAFATNSSPTNLLERREDFFRKSAFYVVSEHDDPFSGVWHYLPAVIWHNKSIEDIKAPYRAMVISAPSKRFLQRVQQSFDDEEAYWRPFWKKWQHWLVIAFLAYGIYATIIIATDARFQRRKRMKFLFVAVIILGWMITQWWSCAKPKHYNPVEVTATEGAEQ